MPSRFNAPQRDALDAIGDAYESGGVTFDRAAELRDLVRMGAVMRALRLLGT